MVAINRPPNLILLQEWELNDIDPPGDYVDLGVGCAAKARKGIIERKPKHTLSNKNSRFQRGQDLFRALFADLVAASRRLSEEDGKPHPVLFVDMTCWAAHSMLELRPQRGTCIARLMSRRIRHNSRASSKLHRDFRFSQQLVCRERREPQL